MSGFIQGTAIYCLMWAAFIADEGIEKVTASLMEFAFRAAMILMTISN